MECRRTQPESGGTVQFHKRLIGAFQAKQAGAERGPGFGESSVQFDGPPETRSGLFQAPLRVQDVSDVVMGFFIVGVGPDGRRKGLPGRLSFAFGMKDVPENIERLGPF